MRIFIFILLFTTPLWAQTRSVFSSAVEVAHPSNYSCRIKLDTVTNPGNGTITDIPLSLPATDSITWDPENWLDDANDEIDLPGPGVYEWILGFHTEDNDQRHMYVYNNLFIYIADGAVTNLTSGDGSGNAQTGIRQAAVGASHSATFRGYFTATNITPFLYLRFRAYSDGNSPHTDLAEGYIYVNRKSDTSE